MTLAVHTLETWPQVPRAIGPNISDGKITFGTPKFEAVFCRHCRDSKCTLMRSNWTMSEKYSPWIESNGRNLVADLMSNIMCSHFWF